MTLQLVLTPGCAMGCATPGKNLVAIDTPKRTYLDYVTIPADGSWRPEVDGWPTMAEWEQQTTYTALRFVPFTPGMVLTPAAIITLLPTTSKASRTLRITDPPYSAPVAPADATSAIAAALMDAAALAKPGDPVDVLIPPGTYNHSTVLSVFADVRLRRDPEDTGGVLVATNPAQAAIRLAGDRAGALFLSLKTSPTARSSQPASCGIWIDGSGSTDHVVRGTLVIGTEIDQSQGINVFGRGDEGGVWAFNYAHDGFASAFYQTDRTRFVQVVANRAQGLLRGEDLYAVASYANEDPVHHVAYLANWGRDGRSRGMSVVGGGFIHLEGNDIARTQQAGLYLAREAVLPSFGAFDIDLIGNTVSSANLNGNHDGLLAYSDDPAGSAPSLTFGTISNQIRNLVVRDNVVADTAPGMSQGYGIDVRSSCAGGEVVNNQLLHNHGMPQLKVDGSGFTIAGNVSVP